MQFISFIFDKKYQKINNYFFENKKHDFII